MLKESSEYDDKAESGSKSHSENKTASQSQLPSQSQLQKNAEDVADVILWERISELQKTLDSAKTVAAHLTVTVSAATGKVGYSLYIYEVVHKGGYSLYS